MLFVVFLLPLICYVFSLLLLLYVAFAMSASLSTAAVCHFVVSDELQAYETAKATAEAEGKSRFVCQKTILYVLFLVSLCFHFRKF